MLGGNTGAPSFFLNGTEYKFLNIRIALIKPDNIYLKYFFLLRIVNELQEKQFSHRQVRRYDEFTVRLSLLTTIVLSWSCVCPVRNPHLICRSVLSLEMGRLLS